METGRLPHEIWRYILHYLDYPGAIALRMTNWDFHRHFAALNKAHGKVSFTMDDLLQIETWAEYDFAGQSSTPQDAKQACSGLDAFACSVCLRIRDASHFTNAMMKGSRSKERSKGRDRRSDRFCIECGVRGHRFTQPGVPIRFGGRQSGWQNSGYGAICPGCRQFHILREFKMDDRANYCNLCIPSSQRESVNI